MVPMPPTGIPQFQRLFRAAASLDIDKDDLKRYEVVVATRRYAGYVAACASVAATRKGVLSLLRSATSTRNTTASRRVFRSPTSASPVLPGRGRPPSRHVAADSRRRCTAPAAAASPAAGSCSRRFSSLAGPCCPGSGRPAFHQPCRLQGQRHAEGAAQPGLRSFGLHRSHLLPSYSRCFPVL